MQENTKEDANWKAVTSETKQIPSGQQHYCCAPLSWFVFMSSSGTFGHETH